MGSTENVQKAGGRRWNEVFTWLSDRELALRVRGLGSNPVAYTFLILLFYLERKPTEPSRRFVSIS